MIEDIKRDLLEIYKNKPHRMRHIEGVLQTAIEFGKKFKLDLHKLELAALLHDITKYYPLNEQKEIIKANYSNADYILNNYNDKILHSYSAAFVAKEKYGITDNDVLGAIMHHTIGKANMNMYEKIIFLSDYIEPGRVYESCVKARELAKDNISAEIVDLRTLNPLDKETLIASVNKTKRALVVSESYYSAKSSQRQ